MLDFGLFFSRLPFPAVFVLFAEVADCLLGFQSVKEFSRQHHPNGKFLPSDEEGNYPPSFSLKILNVSVYIYLKLNHSALGVIWEGVQYSCKRLAEHDSGFGQARTAG